MYRIWSFLDGTGFAFNPGRTIWKEIQMEATIKEARMAAEARLVRGDETLSSVRYAESNLLSELPGIAFGLITLVYILGTFAALL